MKSKALLFLGLVALATGAAAQNVPAGTGTLVGAQRIKASGCGKDRDVVSLSLTLDANGAWTADVDGDEFSGTSTTMGRVTRITFDGGSFADLEEELAEDASDLCGENVVVTSFAITQAQLKVNKRHTAAKLQLKARATGMTSMGSGTGKFELKAVGAWVALP